MTFPLKSPFPLKSIVLAGLIVVAFAASSHTDTRTPSHVHASTPI